MAVLLAKLLSGLRFISLLLTVLSGRHVTTDAPATVSADIKSYRKALLIIVLVATFSCGFLLGCVF